MHTKSYIKYLEAFLDMMSAERAAAKNTIDSYRLDILDFFGFVNTSKLELLVIDIQDINQFISGLVNNKKLSPRSISRKLSAVKQLYHFLLSEGIIKKNPALNVEMPKIGRPLPKALVSETVVLLLQAASVDVSVEGLRNYCMLQVLYSTGMRVSELVSLKLSDLKKVVQGAVDLSAIIIKGKGGKERLVILNSEALTAINSYLHVRAELLRGSESDYLFPSFAKSGKPIHLTRQRFFQTLKLLASNAGLDIKSVSPHKIRHSFASMMINQGAGLRTVQELLGHSDISSTQIYTKIFPEKAFELVLGSHPLVTK